MRNCCLTPVFLLASVFALQAQQATDPKIVTFNKDVAPILYKNCAICHHPNDIAPMSLLTYNDARPWAAAIRQAVVQRVMPPWHADPHVGEFINDPRLSDQELNVTQRVNNTGNVSGHSS